MDGTVHSGCGTVSLLLRGLGSVLRGSSDCLTYLLLSIYSILAVFFFTEFQEVKPFFKIKPCHEL